MGKQLTPTMKEKNESLVSVSPDFKASVATLLPSSGEYVTCIPCTLKKSLHIFLLQLWDVKNNTTVSCA